MYIDNVSLYECAHVAYHSVEQYLEYGGTVQVQEYGVGLHGQPIVAGLLGQQGLLCYDVVGL